MRRTVYVLTIVLGLVLAAPGAARAGCSVMGMEGQVLTVEELEAGSWEKAVQAVRDLMVKARFYGSLFGGVYGGHFKGAQVRADLERTDAEWEELTAAMTAAVAPFEGTCAGEVLASAVRKAESYRSPERNMVLGVLDGKPVKTTQKDLHDRREDDYRAYERRFVRLTDGAQVQGGQSDGPPPDGEDAGDAGEAAPATEKTTSGE